MKAARKFKDMERAKDKVGCQSFYPSLPFPSLVFPSLVLSCLWEIINSVAVFCIGVMKYGSELFITYLTFVSTSSIISLYKGGNVQLYYR